jgi:glycine hydroxymethyltransferase
MSTLTLHDPIINQLIHEETLRQTTGLELIPSENYVSDAVLEALGSVFTNKYSEGYPGKRYYGGNEVIDKLESLAIERAKKLFGAEHVNVQPYSGSPANFAVYTALLKPGDTFLGMALTAGGHLTHGHKVSASGIFFNAIQYGVDKDGLIDYDEIERLAKQHKPKLIVCGATAYSRLIDFKRILEIARSTGALAMADIAHIAGLVIAKLHPDPIALGFDVVTTTTHKTLRGPRAAMIFCKKEHANAIDKAIFPGLQGGPHENTIAAIAVALKEAHTPEYVTYIEQVVNNAHTLATTLKELGYTIVAGKTENHLLLIDLTSKKVTGQLAQDRLGAVGITVNKNTIPHEPRSPFDPSGIRLGTPAVTTRGMKEDQMRQIARFIDEAISDPHAAPSLKRQIANFAQKFPLFQWSK